MTTLHQAFRPVHDPRINKKKHLLLSIIVLDICAMLCGAESYDSIELFGKNNYTFLKQILRLPNGIPSYEIINYRTM